VEKKKITFHYKHCNLAKRRRKKLEQGEEKKVKGCAERDVKGLRL